MPDGPGNVVTVAANAANGVTTIKTAKQMIPAAVLLF
jgi:hypothetical protein